MREEMEWRDVLRLIGSAVADKAVQWHIEASQASLEEPSRSAALRRQAETLDAVANAIIAVLEGKE